MRKRTTTHDVNFDGSRLNVVRLADGCVVGSLLLPDAETRAAVAEVLRDSAAVGAASAEPKATPTTTKKRTTKKAE